MSRNISTGIDIGSYQVKVVVAENAREKEKIVPKIIGTGYAESRGLRHGYILNQTDAVASVKSAIAEAEKTSGVKIKKVLLSVGGIGLGSVESSGSAVVSKADGEITDFDIRKVVENSQAEIPASASANRKIIHTVPIQYKVDGKIALGNPAGMKGSKLEVKTLFITCLEHHISDLVSAVEEAGAEVEDVVAAPIAASLVTLTKTQKIAGCVLANIGSETISMAVFENNTPVSLEVLPIGSSDITNDIALGFRISIEEAEEIKRGGMVGDNYPRKKLEDIIEARLSDIFDLIDAHLKKIGRSGLLPAGIVLTGGGSGLGMVEMLAKSSLRLPSRVASITFGTNSHGPIKNTSWSVSYGLCILGLNTEENETSGIKITRRTGKNIISWLKQFLP